MSTEKDSLHSLRGATHSSPIAPVGTMTTCMFCGAGQTIDNTKVLRRAGQLDEPTERLFETLQATIQRPSTFAMTTVFVAYGIVP